MLSEFVGPNNLFITFYENRQQNRRHIVKQADTLSVEIRSVRLAGQQPSVSQDRATLGIILQFIRQFERHKPKLVGGKYTYTDDDRNDFYNICHAICTLSKYKNYSLKKKYTTKDKEYGYNILDALEFISYTFQFPATCQQAGLNNQAFYPLPDKALQSIAETEIAIIEDIIIKELSGSSVKQAIIDQPYQTHPVIFSYYCFYRDTKTIDRLLVNLKPFIALYQNKPDWRNTPYVTHAVMYGLQTIGEFLQEPHLSETCRWRFLVSELIVLQELRNRLEHAERKPQLFDGKIFTATLFNNIVDSLKRLYDKLSIIKQQYSNISNLSAPNHENIMRFFQTFYEHGVKLSEPERQRLEAAISCGYRNKKNQMIFLPQVSQTQARDMIQAEDFYVKRLANEQSVHDSTIRFRANLQTNLGFSSIEPCYKSILQNSIPNTFRAIITPESLSIDAVTELHEQLKEPQNGQAACTINNVKKVLEALDTTLQHLPSCADYFAPLVSPYPETVYPVKMPQMIHRFIQLNNPDLDEYVECMQKLQGLDGSYQEIYLVAFYGDIVLQPQYSVTNEMLSILSKDIETDITQFAQKIIVYMLQENGTKNSTEYIKLQILSAELRANDLIKQGMIYQLKVLVELTRYLPDAIKAQVIPEQLWPEIIAMRNVLAHSNPYVDIYHVSLDGLLMRYASIFLKSIRNCVNTLPV